MFCIKCGHKLPEGSQFCEKCGAKVSAEQTTSQTTTNSSSSSQSYQDQNKATGSGTRGNSDASVKNPKKSNIPWILVAIVAIFAVINIFGDIVSSFDKAIVNIPNTKINLKSTDLLGTWEWDSQQGNPNKYTDETWYEITFFSNGTAKGSIGLDYTGIFNGSHINNTLGKLHGDSMMWTFLEKEKMLQIIGYTYSQNTVTKNFKVSIIDGILYLEDIDDSSSGVIRYYNVEKTYESYSPPLEPIEFTDIHSIDDVLLYADVLMSSLSPNGVISARSVVSSNLVICDTEVYCISLYDSNTHDTCAYLCIDKTTGESFVNDMYVAKLLGVDDDAKLDFDTWFTCYGDMKMKGAGSIWG